MAFQFDSGAATSAFGERVKWRQDKSPHAEGSFDAVVLHGESQSESAGATRGAFAADPWTMMVESSVAVCADLRAGDTIEIQDGQVLTVQQVTKDRAFGWVIRLTSSARAPK